MPRQSNVVSGITVANTVVQLAGSNSRRKYVVLLSNAGATAPARVAFGRDPTITDGIMVGGSVPVYLSIEDVGDMITEDVRFIQTGNGSQVTMIEGIDP